MTAVATEPRAGWRRRHPPIAIPALSARLQIARAALVVVFAVSVSLLLELVVVSNLQQRAAQQRAFDRFRSELATGTAPVGPTDAEGRQLTPGTPVAYLEIPSIDVRQVIVEGTSPSNLFTGPGHRRDSPLPGQEGVSIVLGRRAAFGGPFGRLVELRDGALIRVTTGQGEFDYRVSGVRADGDPAPAPVEPGGGRLMLATAGGRPFMPAGVLRIDADLETEAVGGARPLIDTRSLPASEQLMSADSSTLWALALWLQALILVSVAAVWAWHRWGPARTWVVFLPPLLLFGLAASGEVARLIPNLL